MLSRRSPNSGKKNTLINCHCLHQASNLSAGRSLQLPASHRAPPPPSAPAHHPIIGRTSSKRISTSCQRCFPSSCQARCGGRRAAPDVNDGLIKAPCVFTQRVSARPPAAYSSGASSLLANRSVHSASKANSRLIGIKHEEPQD